MRVYEIILSYDNGNRDYGYTNGLVFQPVNDEILNKFSSKRDELTGYKYKKFNIDEFKGLLSAPTEAERESTKSKKKKDPASADKKKFDREEAINLIASGEMDRLLDFNLRGADLHRANLCEANLQRANLRGADLRGANIDYACWPLWCGSLGVKVDVRIARQLAYHLCALDCDDPEYIKARNAILDFANRFHRADECGILEAEIKNAAPDTAIVRSGTIGEC